MTANKNSNGRLPASADLDVEVVLAHMTFRQACKKFLHCEDYFFCSTYSNPYHSKYIFLIKWKNYPQEFVSWEEEADATSEGILRYKKQHNLPEAIEYDNFDVQAFLQEAVMKEDPEVSEKVALFLKNNWIQPE